MFEELHQAVADLAVPPSGDALEQMYRLRDALDARIAEAETRYVAEGGFEIDGFPTMAAFLRERCRLSPAAARAASARAARLRCWPEVLEAWVTGAIAGSRVDLLARQVPERHVERFSHTAAEVCALVAPLSHRQATQVLEHWVACADAAAEREAIEAGIDPPPADVQRELWVSATTGGVAVVKGELDADTAALTLHALRMAQRPDVEGEHRTPAQRRADALGEIARFYLDNHTSLTSTRRQERLAVVCDVVGLYASALRGAGVRTAAELSRFLAERPGLGPLERGLFLEAFDGHGSVARTLDGNPISDGLLSTIAEGGLLERLLTVGSRVIDHGRSLRNHTPAQWRALAARDGGCRFPGCDDGPDGCHAHHVERWEAGGRTDLANGVLLSPHCHTVISQPGWSDRLEPDGTYVVTTPDGREMRSDPPGIGGQPPPPLHTTADAAPPLPFDPTPTRAAPQPPRSAPPPDEPAPEDAPDVEPETTTAEPLDAVLLDADALEKAVGRLLDDLTLVPWPRAWPAGLSRPRADLVIDGMVLSLS